VFIRPKNLDDNSIKPDFVYVNTLIINIITSLRVD
jgi:hypothetical protein